MDLMERFRWRGELIPDIEEWAKQRGEPMIHYVATRQTIFGIQRKEGKMPLSFWQGLRMTDGWWYVEVPDATP
jgi:hypothetical protein